MSCKRTSQKRFRIRISNKIKDVYIIKGSRRLQVAISLNFYLIISNCHLIHINVTLVVFTVSVLLLVDTNCTQTINLKLNSQLVNLLDLFVWSFLKPDKSVASLR